MLAKIEIENYKSIYMESIELGRVNVFIGENGCGKTNVLEAVGMASAASEGKMKNDELAFKGIRVTKPSITFSSFLENKTKSEFNIICEFDDLKENERLRIRLSVENPDEIISEWRGDYIDTKKIEKKVKRNISKHKEYSKYPETIDKIFNSLPFFSFRQYKIFNLSTRILRGIGGTSFEIPGIHGENLDILISNFSEQEFHKLLDNSHFISWLEDIVIDREGGLRLEGHNLNLSQSKLYFRDKFMEKKNNIFSAENANEGILHVLFYLALFISKRTPKFFAIDNIETALNPQLCRMLMVELIKLAKKNDKQVLITTHNPAILDGLNLHDDEVRLFTVSRNLKGHTKVKRLELKPDVELNGNRMKLSELWMRGHLGALPHHF